MLLLLIVVVIVVAVTVVVLSVAFLSLLLLLLVVVAVVAVVSVAAVVSFVCLLACLPARLVGWLLALSVCYSVDWLVGCLFASVCLLFSFGRLLVRCCYCSLLLLMLALVGCLFIVVNVSFCCWHAVPMLLLYSSCLFDATVADVVVTAAIAAVAVVVVAVVVVLVVDVGVVAAASVAIVASDVDDAILAITAGSAFVACC